MRRRLVLVVLGILVVACGESSADTATTNAPGASTPTAVTTTSIAPTTTEGPASASTAGLTTTTAPHYDVAIEGGTEEVPDLEVNGPEQFEYHVGQTVHITVLSPVSDEIHVHGYDLKFDTEAGTPVTIEFSAGVQGIFEVELESAGLHLFDIRVDP